MVHILTGLLLRLPPVLRLLHEPLPPFQEGGGGPPQSTIKMRVVAHVRPTRLLPPPSTTHRGPVVRLREKPGLITPPGVSVRRPKGWGGGEERLYKTPSFVNRSFSQACRPQGRAAGRVTGSGKRQRGPLLRRTPEPLGGTLTPVRGWDRLWENLRSRRKDRSVATPDVLFARSLYRSDRRQAQTVWRGAPTTVTSPDVYLKRPIPRPRREIRERLGPRGGTRERHRQW